MTNIVDTSTNSRANPSTATRVGVHGGRGRIGGAQRHTRDPFVPGPICQLSTLGDNSLNQPQQTLL